jgi:hypothetical protein
MVNNTNNSIYEPIYVTGINDIRLSLAELEQFINSFPKHEAIEKKAIGGFFQQTETGDWKVYLHLADGRDVNVWTMSARKAGDGSSLFCYSPSIHEKIDNPYETDLNPEFIKDLANTLRSDLVNRGVLDEREKENNKDSGHYNYSKEGRKRIADEFRAAWNAGEIHNKEAWAGTKGITGKTLNKYLDENPENK